MNAPQENKPSEYQHVQCLPLNIDDRMDRHPDWGSGCKHVTQRICCPSLPRFAILWTTNSCHLTLPALSCLIFRAVASDERSSLRGVQH